MSVFGYSTAETFRYESLKLRFHHCFHFTHAGQEVWFNHSVRANQPLISSSQTKIYSFISASLSLVDEKCLVMSRTEGDSSCHEYNPSLTLI